MDYEYDDDKSKRTFYDRRIDFDFAARVFDGEFIEYEDRRKDYGEKRFVVIGPIGRRRIISARRASRRERRAYHDTIA
jgi:uncharacterized DUF497 family protein